MPKTPTQVFSCEYCEIFRTVFFIEHPCMNKDPRTQKCVTNILEWWNLVQLYLKKMPKIYESRDVPLEFWLHQYFFTGNQQILLYQKVQIEIPFWYIISYFLLFFLLVFKYCLNKHALQFWWFQQNLPLQAFLKLKYFEKIVTWLKLYCKCGHVTKTC